MHRCSLGLLCASTLCHTLGITSYHEAQPISPRTLRPRCSLTLFPEYYLYTYLQGSQGLCHSFICRETKSISSADRQDPRPGRWSTSSYVPLCHPCPQHSASVVSGLWTTPADLVPLETCTRAPVLTSNRGLARLATVVSVGQKSTKQEWDHQASQEHLDPVH